MFHWIPADRTPRVFGARRKALRRQSHTVLFDPLERRRLLSAMPAPDLDAFPDSTGFARVTEAPSPSVTATAPSDPATPLVTNRLPTLVGARVFTNAALTTTGLTGTYINRNLRDYAKQDDWRTSQTVAGSRVDSSLDFQTATWGARSPLGITGGTDADWDNYSVQWDGYLKVDAANTRVYTRSDDSSRLWIDLNNDGVFATSGPEFIDNHWGTPQAVTTGTRSQPLPTGVYRVRTQYEEGGGGNIFQLYANALPAHALRVGYLIPENRTPQSDAVTNLRAAVRSWQDWYRDQMVRYGLGSKSFSYETEADGVTPRINVLNVPGLDSYYRADDAGNNSFEVYNRAIQAANNAGASIFGDGEVWLLISECHQQLKDGRIVGAVSLGTGGGSGSAGGVGVIGSNQLAVLGQDDLADDRAYNGLVIPALGPSPLIQDVSFGWFEGTTVSSISSSSVGAALHELTHGFGVAHDGRNDENFHGNLMGNGLRGYRGTVYPDRYPSDETRLGLGEALELSRSRFFNANVTYTDNVLPALSLGVVDQANGLLRVRFKASDSSGLGAALLFRNGEMIGELNLSGAGAADTLFATPFYTAGAADQFRVDLFDVQGNKSSQAITFTPSAAVNHAAVPWFKVLSANPRAGKKVTLYAAATSDPDASGPMTFQWDLNNDGVYDTPPSSAATFDTTFTTAATRMIGLRVTDGAGAVSLAEPVAIRVRSTLPPVITSLSDGPDPVPAGAAVTLTANGVSDPEGAALTVRFYRESNGVAGLQTSGSADVLLATDTTGPYSATVSTAGLALGTYTYYARATDNAAAVSNVVVTTNTVIKPTVTIAASDSSAAEAGANTGRFTLTRNGGTASALTINLTRGGNAINGTDYNTIGSTVSFPAGSSTVNVTITPKEDTRVEGSETVTLAVGSSSAYTIGSPSSATLTIADNEPTTGTASIAGSLYNDLDGDGVKETGEGALAGWTVYLDADSDGVLDTSEKRTTTDTSGNYRLASLPAGVHRVRVVKQSGYRISAPSAGLFDQTLSSGQAVTGKTFALTQRVLISGTVFNDANGNRLKDSGEAGLGSWTIQVLRDADGNGTFETVAGSKASDASGNWTFVSIAAGRYRVQIVQKSGWTRTTPTSGYYEVTLASGAATTGRLFGEKSSV